MNLIVGATGHLGGLIAHRLLGQGQSVRALVRESSDYAALREAGAETAVGDLKDASCLGPACDGVQRIVATATAAARGGEDTLESVDRAGYSQLIAAAQEAGVEQLMFVSAHGFETDSPLPLARAKADTEKALKASGLGFTILRPALFMESWIGFVLGGQLEAGSQLGVVGDPDRLYPFVSAEDVADLAVASLEHPEAQQAVIPLSAGTASFRQVVGWMGEALGQEIEIQSIEPGSEVPGLPPIISDIWAFAAQGGIDAIETPEVADKFGLELKSPEQFVRQTFAQ